MKQLSRSIPAALRLGLQTERITSGCWIWQGSTNKKGYGRIGYQGRREQVQRLSWMLHFGAIPNGLYVCHRCDTPPCINPKHLFLGTAKDNAQDCIAKGRFKYNRVNGERVGTSKLTAKEVTTIRFRAKTEPVKNLAAEYGLNVCYVHELVAGRTWRHLPL